MATSLASPIYRWTGTAWQLTDALSWNGSAWEADLPWILEDDVTLRTLYEMGLNTTWANGAKYQVEETAWPNNPSTYPNDLALWNVVANAFLSALDRLGLDRSFYSSGRCWGSGYNLALYYAASQTSAVAYAAPQATVYEAHMSPGNWSSGTTVSGADFNAVIIGNSSPQLMPYSGGYFSNLNPGVPNDSGNLHPEYFYPQLDDLTYIAGRGIDTIRLSVRWERLQPALASPLNTAELGRLTTAIANAHSVGIQVIPCLFNNYGYFLQDTSGAVNLETVQMQSAFSNVTQADFVDFWTRLATALNGTPGLKGYAPYNEPYLLAESTTTGSEIGTGGSFASGSITGWTATGATLAGDTTHQRVGSTGCLAITATSTALSITSPYCPVTAGTPYTAFAAMRAASTNTTPNPAWEVTFEWFDGSDNYLGQSFGYFAYTYPAGWSRSGLSAVAPAGATQCKVRVWFVSAVTVGDVYYVDNLQAFAATSLNTAGDTWEKISQAVVTAIRTVDSASNIYIDLEAAAGQLQAAEVHPGGPWITDTADKTIYCFHPYYDRCLSSSGAYGSSSVGLYLASYADENAAAIAQGY